MDKQNNSSDPNLFRALPDGFVCPDKLSGLDPNSSILVGFSGGADSSALLDMLCSYAQKSGAKIYAAHINHGIRGAEALRDEEFCRKRAQCYNIPLFVLSADVPSLAKSSGQSIELCARNIRYDFFAKIMSENSIPLLATAHNANDNLETVLFNLTRGSGLRGLCGIPDKRECRGGMLIRPILHMSREDILKYCRENGLDYVTDSTNTDTDYTRNKIRANIIPVLKEITHSPESRSVEMSALLRRDDIFLSELADEFLDANLTDRSTLPLSTFNAEHESVTSRAVIKLFDRIAEPSSSLEQIHVESILQLCKKAIPHSRLSLPSGINAVIENSELKLDNISQTEKFEPQPFDMTASLGENPISQINAEIVIGNTQSQINIYKKSIQFAIDSAKIEGILKLRSRREGDRILIGGMHKSLKKLMCEKKIPLDERYRLPVIYDDDGIVAVPFVATRDGCRINNKKECQSALSIQFLLY